MEEAAAANPVPKYLRQLQIPPRHKELIESLPVDNTIGSKYYLYRGFWMHLNFLLGTLSCNDHVQARHSDIFLVSFPKTGSTWLKALAYAVTKRAQFPDLKQHPLLTANPHELVPFLEHSYIDDNSPDFGWDEHPRLLASHLPYVMLPSSVLGKGCKIVYLCRNPKDTFISLWRFIIKVFPHLNVPLEEELKRFTDGVSPYGPYWDHVLSYWKEKKDRILFIKYEEMKKNQKEAVRKLGEFFECPFSPAEEANGVVEEILMLCSFEHMSNLEVNRTGKASIGVPNNAFSRRGEVGDSANFLSPESANLIDQITAEKLGEHGLVI